MILVFGRNGQVARALQDLDLEARCLGRTEADLSDPAACVRAIRDHTPTAVINAAAYTAVDRAEQEEDLATVINGAAPTAMAQVCTDMGIPLVHISTDYVFDGGGTQPFTPECDTAPLNAYGRSKLAGEVGVAAAGGPHAILRTSWVFSAQGANFLRAMLRLGRERAHLSVVADQMGGPTPARAIAHACLTIAQCLQTDPGKAGTYHISGAPDTSWAEFARAIMQAAALDCRIEDIPTTAYPTPARRPLNSRLNCDSLAVFGLTRPDWRAGLHDMITEAGDHSE